MPIGEAIILDATFGKSRLPSVFQISALRRFVVYL